MQKSLHRSMSSLGFGGHLTVVHGQVLKNPYISFLLDVPHCVDDHPIEVSSPLPWDFGSRFFPPGLDVYRLDLRLY